MRLARSFDLGGDLRALDMGCSTGRLVGALAAQGARVVGMDPQLENLAEARRVAARTPGEVEIVAGGFDDLDAVEAFELIVAVADAWWYLRSATDRADALLRVHRALRPGGLVVLEGRNLEWILDHYREPQPNDADVNGVGVRRHPRHDIDRAAGTWTHTDTFRTVGKGDELTMVHGLAIIPVAEVRAALDHAGFEPRRVVLELGVQRPG